MIAVWQAVSARAEIDQLRQELADARAVSADTLIANASLTQQVDEFTRQTNVLRAADVVFYALTSQPGAPDGVVGARAYVTQQRGLVFTAESLPALPAGKIYQLWVIVDAKAVSAEYDALVKEKVLALCKNACRHTAKRALKNVWQN